MPTLLVKHNDEHVSDLTDDAMQMLKRARTQYDLESEVSLYETVHGHIACFNRKADRYVPGSEGKAARIDSEDAAFCLSLPGLRWIEFYTNRVVVAFDNCAITPAIDPVSHLCELAAKELADAVSPHWQGLQQPELTERVARTHKSVHAVHGIAAFNRTLEGLGRYDLVTRPEVGPDLSPRKTGPGMAM